MDIALIGFGKMGQCIDQMAQEKGHRITSRLSRRTEMSLEDAQAFAKSDAAIDFSAPGCVLSHLELCLSHRIPLVIGTTGWTDVLPKAKERVEKEGGCCLYAPNFSLGVYLFQKIATFAFSLMQPFSDYDVCGVEYHHRQKIDSPSGTALALTDSLLTHMPRIQDFQFTSVRCGHIPGTHTLVFDSLADTLTLSHEARSRQGFAQGALLAAEWLKGKKGFFTLDDMMEDISSKGS